MDTKDDDECEARSDADAALEAEIRRDRKFSLEEAIMRLVGPGMMKGVAPTTRKQQAEAVLQDYIRRHVSDSSGALQLVLGRHVKESELLIKNLDQPFAVLAGCIQRVLGSEYLLAEFVRAVDVEWGRILGERPFFETKGRSADPDDPYTIESVRGKLSDLVAHVAAGET